MRCNCESSYCQIHRPGDCKATATRACAYIGGVCEPCAAGMIATGGADYIGGPLAGPRVNDARPVNGEPEAGRWGPATPTTIRKALLTARPGPTGAGAAYLAGYRDGAADTLAGLERARAEELELEHADRVADAGGWGINTPGVVR